jgi:hypothetical protein
MKKGFYIVGLIAFLAVFAACEKCEKPVFNEDPFATDRSQASKTDGIAIGEKGGELDDNTLSGGLGKDITDPDEDEDFDGIVDPDEDEDFDKDGDGK